MNATAAVTGARPIERIAAKHTAPIAVVVAVALNGPTIAVMMPQIVRMMTIGDRPAIALKIAVNSSLMCSLVSRRDEQNAKNSSAPRS